jgi:DNA repair protein RecO (recombination protein O)
MPITRLTTPAVIVRLYPLGESDRLAVLLTPEHGLARAVAKGQRRSKKRFAGLVDLLYYLEVELSARKSEIMLLEGARLRDAFPALSDKPVLFAAGCHLAEVAAAFATDTHSDPAAFTALIDGLAALCRGADPAKVSRAVEAQTLRAAGLTPRLDACGVTGQPLDDAPVVSFEPLHGGAVSLEKAAPGSLRLALGARRILQTLLQSDLAAALAVEWSKEEQRAVRHALAQMIAFHTNRRLKARLFAEATARFLREHQKPRA